MDKRILVGADPAGLQLKNAVKADLEALGYEVTDVGTLDAAHEVDYYEVGRRAGKAVSEGTFSRAIIFCGTGMGVHIVANKFKGVACAVCETDYAVRQCRAINNCNILAMGGFLIAPHLGIQMAHTFLDTPFADGRSESSRAFLSGALEQIAKIEEDIYG
nr:RpiB/LacA/LacB family sugar-phosphate isomerase [Maliibacterium massiliense]